MVVMTARTAIDRHGAAIGRGCCVEGKAGDKR
jgi:hypothetical protein